MSGRASRRVRAALATAISLSTAIALAGAPDYLGAWRITSAVVAPWADRAHLDPAEENRLLGRIVTLTPDTIVGPQPFACRGPHYRLETFTADLLFEGQLGEMQASNPRISAQALAASLGFAGQSWKVLDTGCEIDWHFTGPHTAKIGLNDFVYTLSKL